MGYTGGPMTEAMYYILLALLQPSHGYRLMQAVSEVSGGRVKTGPGTLYGVLARLEADGLILQLSRWGARRKTYALTPAGRQALAEEYRRLQGMVRDLQRMTGGADPADWTADPPGPDGPQAQNPDGLQAPAGQRPQPAGSGKEDAK